MSQSLQNKIQEYVNSIKEIYGIHLRRIILYGSYARGDAREDSDIDIMILLDISDDDIKSYRHKLTEITFDYNMDNDLEIIPIAKNENHFNKWIENYPFYANINREGVTLYAA